MIRYWLDLPTPGLFGILCVLYYGVALLLIVAVFHSPLKRPVQSLTGIVAPYFNSVAILFALLTGFLANDISDRNRQSVRAVQAEAGELRNVYTLSVASKPDMDLIRAKWRAYVDSVVNQEWPAMANNQSSAPTYVAYSELLKEVSDPDIAQTAGPAVSAALLGAAVRVGTARSERLALASGITNEMKWLVVIILAMFTQLTIALVHIERPRAFITALTVFSSAVIVVLGIIAMQEYPFSGPLNVAPDPIVRLLALDK
jgi:hypothetical protein